MSDSESPNLFALLSPRRPAPLFLGTAIESQSQEAAPRADALVFAAGLLGCVGLLDVPASSTAIH